MKYEREKQQQQRMVKRVSHVWCVLCKYFLTNLTDGHKECVAESPLFETSGVTDCERFEKR
jgi:hypothetical protein